MSAAASKVKPRGWQPGQSGNPAGRRPNAPFDVAAACRVHAPAAIAALVRGLRDPKHYQACAQALLDRAFGKPEQHVSTTSENSITHLHILAARAIAAELPTIDAKPEPVDTKRLHLFDPPEE